ncbi:unnamed protein product [Prorocentrum cordatum]|uniref:EF-hand domain-containing protein n=1 Tax=Prorocentrum cordatum TaxID=2364126 RepID=A0ABN9TAG5_9DINO|nr:unnamed protein product [Polarella glacialis]
MREKGDGNTTLAWRRYFDSDGDGNLSFSEFCGALAMFGYKRDALDLWRGLAGDESLVSLEVVDRDGAAICDYFADWCLKVKGGPLEVFRAMDSDESLSLTPQETAMAGGQLGRRDDYGEDADVKIGLGS